jgi:hypothetical protein
MTKLTNMFRVLFNNNKTATKKFTTDEILKLVINLNGLNMHLNNVISKLKAENSELKKELVAANPGKYLTDSKTVNQ